MPMYFRNRAKLSMEIYLQPALVEKVPTKALWQPWRVLMCLWWDA
jgi:hypothetical protein